MKTVITWFFSVFFMMTGITARAEVAYTDHIRAELVSGSSLAMPGETVFLALQQNLAPKWHIYWRNPGSSGEPVSLTWKLPENVTTGPILWPLPQAIPTGPLINYGYEGEVLFPLSLTIPEDFEGEVLHLQAEAFWLVCHDICIPEETVLNLTLNIGQFSKPNKTWSGRIAQTLREIPKAEPGFEAGVSFKNNLLSLDVVAPSFIQGGIRKPYFFPYDSDVIDHDAPQKADLAQNGVRLVLTPGFATQKGIKKPLKGVLAFEKKDDRGAWKRQGVEILARPGQAFDLQGLQEEQALKDIDPSKNQGGKVTSQPGFFLAILFAFLGGVILNLMPCVFPVLSMKALNFIDQAEKDPGSIRRHGLAFLLGVEVSFLVLAGTLILLKGAGAQIGWGFQLQSPFVVGFLTLLIFTIGLNLLGVFEFGSSLSGLGSGLAERGGMSGAFFTGVLAVLVATPCTAPFMGAALGFALTQPAFYALIVFAFLGLGLAIPFVLLSFFPSLFRYLPRPGPWMVRFRQLLSFPMFAASVWLIWILALQTDADGVALILLAGLALGFSIWLFKLKGIFVKSLAVISIFLALGCLIILPSPGEKQESVSSLKENTSEQNDRAFKKLIWSPKAVAEQREQGRAVFVDFTAAWCVTCKVNERLALSSHRIKKAFLDREITFFEADWTRRNSEITQALAQYGRTGVPLYLLYPEGNPDVPPVILPQILTESIVLEALEKAAPLKNEKNHR